MTDDDSDGDDHGTDGVRTTGRWKVWPEGRGLDHGLAVVDPPPPKWRPPCRPPLTYPLVATVRIPRGGEKVNVVARERSGVGRKVLSRIQNDVEVHKLRRGTHTKAEEESRGVSGCETNTKAEE